MKRILGFLLKLVLSIVLYGTPVLGVWIASSLVAYSDGVAWWPVAAGLLLFPVLPLLWEAYASWRRRQSSFLALRIFTFTDRLSLRTFFLSFLFIAALLASFPKTTFLALSIRGDWPLQGHTSPLAERARQTLFTLADRLEWLYLAYSPNPYEAYVEADTDAEDDLPIASNSPAGSARATAPGSPPAPADTARATAPDSSTTPADAAAPADTAAVEAVAEAPPLFVFEGWPWRKSALHPAVKTIPPETEQSFESVAQYLAEQEPNPFLRIKALHDYVADRVAYDAEAYLAYDSLVAAGRFPSQSAAAVFIRRLAVCAGYANLFKAMGDALGEEVRVVVGHARSSLSGEIIGDNGHAWNAVAIQGSWYLVDVTWDSGHLNEDGHFEKAYRTDYLLVPPEIIGVSHFPKDPEWQLVETPLSRGEFLRSPMMNPAFYTARMKLVSPTRSQTDVDRQATIKIGNPGGRRLLAKYWPKGQRRPGSDGSRCSVAHGRLTEIECAFPEAKTYEVLLFSAASRSSRYYSFVGRLEFNNRR